MEMWEWAKEPELELRFRFFLYSKLFHILFIPEKIENLWDKSIIWFAFKVDKNDLILEVLAIYSTTCNLIRMKNHDTKYATRFFIKTQYHYKVISQLYHYDLANRSDSLDQVNQNTINFK